MTFDAGWSSFGRLRPVHTTAVIFGFAISAFSTPMLLESRVDALTAMGSSVALVWHNLGVMLVWGAIVLALFLLGLATGLLGLIIVFPVLGHGTWAAWRAIRQPG